MWRQFLSFTSSTWLGTRRPALQSPLIGLLLDDIVIVDGHRIFMHDVLIHQSRPCLIVLRYNLEIKGRYTIIPSSSVSNIKTRRKITLSQTWLLIGWRIMEEMVSEENSWASGDAPVLLVSLSQSFSSGSV